MPSDVQFTAIGHRGGTEVGFQTDASAGGPIKRGVDVYGDELGVGGHCNTGDGIYGLSNLGIGVHGSGPKKEGVYGEGGTTGVHGYSAVGDGVFGEAGVFDEAGTIGVHGKAETGVLGVGGTTSAHGTGVHGTGQTGVLGKGNDNGVHGTGETGVLGEGVGTGVQGIGDTYGVHGTSNQTGVFGDSVAGDGVFGEGGKNGVHGYSAVGDGVFGDGGNNGVHGTGQTGVLGEGIDFGVMGKSVQGRGGVFGPYKRQPDAILMAQLQLLPEPVSGKPALPRGGQAGDLLVTQEVGGSCTLWFCSSDQAGPSPAEWREVQLGPIIPGTG